MDLLALSLGKTVCEVSTTIVYAARCSDPSAMRPIGYVLLLLLAVALAFSATRLLEPLLNGLKLMALPHAAHAGGRDRVAALADLVGDPDLAEGGLLKRQSKD